MAEVETAATSTITGAVLHALIESRREPGEKLYGVVDAARDKELAFDGALRYGWKLQWLFSEDTDQQMRDVAPYLVPITFESTYPYQESEYLDLWAARLGTSAGILVLSAADAQAVRAHFAGVFDMEDDEGERYYFRFYDPRVLRSVLPICTDDNVQRYFGPIGTMVVESAQQDCLLACRPQQDSVAIDEISLVSDNVEEMKLEPK